MARKEWELLFNLSAKQNSSFSSTFKAAQSALVETQGKIQQLNKVQSDISAYQKQQQAVDATRQRLSVLQQQYDNIQKEIQETEGYSSALENKLLSKQAQIDKTTASLNTYEQRLAATGNALHEAGVDTTQLTAESVRLETEVDKLKDKQVDLKKTMDEAGEGAKGFGEKSVEALETVEATLAAVGISKALGEIRDAYMDCINTAGDFEASMSNVEALSGATGEELTALSDKAKEMGATTKFTAGESADALSYMALAGWDTQSMLDGISPVLNLAAAANMDLAQASDIVTDYLTAFGLKASDTTHFVDVMAYAMANSNTDVIQLGEAYKACAATATSLGYSVEETTAVLATMANAGVKGGEAGTALNAIFTRLATNTKECGDTLAEYGVQIYDAHGNMQSLSSILTGMAGIWDTLTDQEQANLAKVIAGTNQYASQQSAADSADDVAAQQQNVANAISDAELRIQDIIAAYKDAYDEAYGSISGQYALWDSAEKVVSTSATSINNALQSQITYWDNYNQNLEKLNERAADIDGLSEVIASFADGSKESVNAIAGMASASDADLAKMVENYAALKEAQDTTSESIADLKTGMSNSMDEIAKTVADTVSEMDMSDEATKSAKETIQGFIDGASSMMPRVQEAYAKIASAASTALAGSNERYNVNHGIPGYAVGTEDAAPGFALVGEHGPELVYFNGGESVLTASETRREMESASVTPMSAELPESNGSSSARSTVPISLSPVYHISGISDTAELQNVLNAQNDSLRELVLEIVKDAEDDDFRGRYA